MNKPKIMTVFGIRLEAIKMAPVIKTLQNDKRLYYEMSDKNNPLVMVKQVKEF